MYNRLKKYVSRLFSKLRYGYWYLRNKPRFRQLGKGSYIKKPLKIDGASNIEIQANVIIGAGTWLASLSLTNCDRSSLILGEGCVIGNYNHIYATSRIEFGKNVLTADKVYISDNSHEYNDITVPVLKQPIKQLKEVFIGDGTWIGENVCIIGACIGKQCVIGSNTVVTKDVPDYCVAVGSPAYIIKRFCFDSNRWKLTKQDGSFVD